MRQFTLVITGLVIAAGLNAQNKNALPYAEIPDYPAQYSAATVAARMIDGLGFRYYWATEGLKDKDLEFRPNEEARTSRETVDHIYELSIMIVNAVQQQTNGAVTNLTFEEKRAATLHNFKAASDILKKSSDKDMAGYNIKFANGIELPFWNLLNGPISDALWHCGQIVSFRRSSGNPFNSRVNVLTGKVKE